MGGMDVTVWEWVIGICAGLGLAAACGFRVFLPLFIAALGIHFGGLSPHAGVEWLGSWPALIGLGVATVLEVAAYYIPWMDNLLDTVASPAAVIAGVLIAAALFVGMDPFLQWTCAIVAGGGAAGSIQGATVLTRAASSATTGGIANPVLSTIENVGAIALAVLAVVVPVFAAALVIAALVLAWRRIARPRSRD